MNDCHFIKLVKAGLILGLFGGTHRFANDKVTFYLLHKLLISFIEVQICKV